MTIPTHVGEYIAMALIQAGVEQVQIEAGVVYGIGSFTTVQPTVMGAARFLAWAKEVPYGPRVPPFLCWTPTHIMFRDVNGGTHIIRRPEVWMQMLRDTTPSA